MNILADISKANPGSIAHLLARVARRAPLGFTMTVLARDDQQAELAQGGIPPGAKLHVVPADAWPQNVARELAIAAAAEHDLTIVASFNSAVIGIPHQLDEGIRAKLHFTPWSQIVTAISSHYWPCRIPLQEAIASVVRVLEQRGATSLEKAIKQTSLRIFLTTHDPRFGRNHPDSGSVPFISRLVSATETAGLIKVVRTPMNADIWLAVEAAQNANPGPQVAFQPASDTATAATPSLAVATVVVPSSVPVARDYKMLLEKGLMGPFPNFREDIYDGMAANASNGLTVDQLVTAAVEYAKVKCPAPGIAVWAAARHFMKSMLSRTAVMMDANGKTFSDNFLSVGTKVADLVPNFRTQIDAELVLFLLRNLPSIPFEDVNEVTGVLYQTRGEKNQAKLSAVVIHLRDAQLAIVTEQSVTLNTATGKVAQLKTVA